MAIHFFTKKVFLCLLILINIDSDKSDKLRILLSTCALIAVNIEQ